ncbi:hypothetical protein WDU94_014593 [Cyamophila willieti]
MKRSPTPDAVASNSHLRGPLFSQEPPPLLEYSSASGTTLTCVAQGIPTPDIKWVDLHGKVVTYIPRLRAQKDERNYGRLS